MLNVEFLIFNCSIFSTIQLFNISTFQLTPLRSCGRFSQEQQKKRNLRLKAPLSDLVLCLSSSQLCKKPFLFHFRSSRNKLRLCIQKNRSHS